MSYKKLRLMEEDEYLRMKDKQIKEYDPELRTMTLLKSEITDLLSNDSMDANEKQKLLNRAQIRFDNLRNIQVEKQPEPAREPAREAAREPEVEVDQEVHAEEVIAMPEVKAMPEVEAAEAKLSDEYIAARVNAQETKFRPRVQHLLKRIQKIPNVISFDADMHPVIGDKTMSKSNFDDIVNFIINPIGKQPPGYVTFTNALLENNIDSSVYSATPPGTAPHILKVYP
jgi:hypothetical protein